MSLYWILLCNLKILILNWRQYDGMLRTEVCRSNTLPLLVKHARCQHRVTNFYNHTDIPNLSTFSRYLDHCTGRLCMDTTYRGYDVTSSMIYSSHPWFGQLPPRIVYKCRRQTMMCLQLQPHDTPGIENGILGEIRERSGTTLCRVMLPAAHCQHNCRKVTTSLVSAVFVS
jgi:hypothetical protein